MSKRFDENLTETTKVLAIRNMLKLFHSLISLVGCVGKVLGPHTDNLKRKGNVLDPFILGYKMYYYPNVSKTYEYI